MAWFARGKAGYRRVLRYLIMGLHVTFAVMAVAYYSTELAHDEYEIDSTPISEKEKKEKERVLIEECAKSKDPLCGL